MSRELASPAIANLIATRLFPAEFDERARAPLTDAEAEDIAELVAWFMRRYPTAKERLDYARRKMRALAPPHTGGTPAGDPRETARRLADAHRATDPQTIAVLLDPDPQGREVRLVEVTHSAPTTDEPIAVGFFARPDLDVPFPCQIVVLSPDEWARVTAGRLALPPPFDAQRLEPALNRPR